jgi:DNA-binding response OmpR family regulator
MNRLLLVHPDPKVRDAVGSILEKSGHRVIQAGDGAQAVAAFKKSSPNMTILHEDLPGMPSFQAYAEIKTISPAAKVVTFAVGESAKDSAGKFGIRAFRPGEVLQIVERLEEPDDRAFPGSILIVDDDAGVRGTLGRFLIEKGYAAAYAPNGLEALPMIQDLRPKLVLLDIDMPRMNGIETLKRLRLIDRTVAVMMITGNDTLEMMEKCREGGAFDYLVKPFDYRYLEFAIYSKLLLTTL